MIQDVTERTRLLPPPPAYEQVQPSMGSKLRKKIQNFGHMFFTWDGLIGSGNVDYKTMFTPDIPFIGPDDPTPPVFYGLNATMPVLLALILGLQHAMAMVGGLVSSSLVLAGTSNLSVEQTSYLVSVALIGSGLLSFVQMSRIRLLPWGNYYIGTGLTSVLGVSFATIPVFKNAVPVMYESGFCEKSKDGVFYACPNAYGAFLGTTCVCSLFETLLALTPQDILLKVFPPIVNGPVVLMIGAELVGAGMEDWAGGSACMARGTLCPSPDAPHPYPWGSPQFILMGFSVFFTIVVCDKWGPPFMKSCSIIVGLMVGCLIAMNKGYFDMSPVSQTPTFQFIGDFNFKIQIYKPIILPILAVYMVILMESIGDIAATCDVSRVETEGPIFESRISGGLLSSGLCSMIGARMHMFPVSSFAQNNGVIAMTQCASRFVGYFACCFLIISGVLGKFASTVGEIPKCVIGGMTTFLFCQVAVSGIRIIAMVDFTRRDRFVLTVSLMFGLASTLVDNWFETFFSYYDDKYENFGPYMDALKIIVGTGPAITGFAGMVANLFFPQVQDNAHSPVSTPNSPSRRTLNSAVIDDDYDEDDVFAGSASVFARSDMNRYLRRPSSSRMRGMSFSSC